MRTVAILYVEENGIYSKISNVELWGEKRDARKYPGPHPVIAHPPCERWGRYSKVGNNILGDDAGCFAAALSAVRRFGGVLEHPEGSAAWSYFDLEKPSRNRGWIPTSGGWTCYVEQGHYGHRARKGTWLFTVGVDLPALKRGVSDVELIPAHSRASAMARGVNPSKVGIVALMSRKQRAATPAPFCDLLLSMARSV